MVDPNESIASSDETKESQRKLSTNADIDHLCNLIDGNRFGCLPK